MNLAHIVLTGCGIDSFDDLLCVISAIPELARIDMNRVVVARGSSRAISSSKSKLAVINDLASSPWVPLLTAVWTWPITVDGPSGETLFPGVRRSVWTRTMLPLLQAFRGNTAGRTVISVVPSHHPMSCETLQVLLKISLTY